MNTSLKVDLDKRTATLVLDYVTLTPIDDEQRSLIIKSLSENKDIITEINGNKILVKIEYDFGIHIPESVWNMRNNSFINGMHDKSLMEYWDQLCKETVLECVRQILPTVLQTLKEKANDLIRKNNE